MFTSQKKPYSAICCVVSSYCAMLPPNFSLLLYKTTTKYLINC